MRLLRSVLVSGAAALAVGAVTVTTASTGMLAAGSRRSSDAIPSAKFIEEARAQLVRYLSHHHPQVMFTHPGSVHQVEGISKATTTNWSGYAVTATKRGAFTRVSAKWTTPRVKCNREDQITSEWVGIDGDGTVTVEQAGTIGWCFRAKPIYFTWFEMYPNPEVEIGTSLRPGDKITASVTRTGKHYRLRVVDATHRSASFTRTASCALLTCVDRSAEWISERSAFAVGVAPLVNYNRWNVTAASVTINGHTGSITSAKSVQKLTMVDATRQYALSTPSGLRNKGHAFSTKWHNSW